MIAQRCFPRWASVLVSLVLLLCFSVAVQAQSILLQNNLAQSKSANSESAELTEAPTSADLQQLMRLLSDEKINRWLQQQVAEQEMVQTDDAKLGFRERSDQRLVQIRQRVQDVARATTALPFIPDELEAYWDASMTPETTLRSIIYLIIFLFIGSGLEWLYWCYAERRLRHLELSNASGLTASAQRAASVGLLRLGGALLFSLGCVGTYLVFDWPGDAGKVVLSVLLWAVSLRLFLVLSRVIFAPASDHLRMVPMSKKQASKAVRWVVGGIAVALLADTIVDTFEQFGISDNANIAIDFMADLTYATIAILAIWSWHGGGDERKVMSASRLTDVQRSAPQSARQAVSPDALQNRGYPIVVPMLWTLFVVLILLLSTFGMEALVWLLMIAALLVPALKFSRHLVNYYFDRAVAEQMYGAGDLLAPVSGSVPAEAFDSSSEVAAGSEKATAEMAQQDASLLPLDPSRAHNSAETMQGQTASDQLDDSSTDESPAFDVYRPVTQRLVRFSVLVSAIIFLFAALELPLWDLYRSPDGGGRAVAAAIDIAAVLLMGDLLWVWVKTLIDKRLSNYEAPEQGQAPGPGARMATLLPLFRKVAFVIIAIMVILVILSSLGVNIAPLIAGAGVIGIAVGFGAQALVKDIVSGVFFLLEDAFRVGEYIEMGDLRGTVESISVRSLRVRHHLGAVHTIPYGELSSLTNHSRDWAIIKIQFRVPFDTDLKMVKKIVKKIGAELQQNEVYGHHILQPLKSQGVRRMEEFNMVVGVKFMATPGQQWTIRRDAYQAIRDAFDKNGLSFAERSVKVEVVGDGNASRETIVGAAHEAVESQIDNQPKPLDDTP